MGRPIWLNVSHWGSYAASQGLDLTVAQLTPNAEVAHMAHLAELQPGPPPDTLLQLLSPLPNPAQSSLVYQSTFFSGASRNPGQGGEEG